MKGRVRELETNLPEPGMKDAFDAAWRRLKLRKIEGARRLTGAPLRKRELEKTLLSVARPLPNSGKLGRHHSPAFPPAGSRVKNEPLRRSPDAVTTNRATGARLVLRQEAFSMSCLPLTSALAAALTLQILPELRRMPTIWPFDDRVLVWLLPSLKADVARFHADAGPCMDEIFAPPALSSIDAALVRLVVERLRVGKRQRVTLDDLIDILAGAES